MPDETLAPPQIMRRAIELALENARNGGGPFAAIIVREGRIVATGVNRVTQENDPTAHAEMVAIREACRALGAFQLEGCDVYTTCEPCPMCLGAMYWARPARVVYGATHEDAARAGFDDAMIYRELARPPEQRRMPMLQLLRPEAVEIFAVWEALEHRVPY